MWEVLAYGAMPFRDVPNAEIHRHLREGLRLQSPTAVPADFWDLVAKVPPSPSPPPSLPLSLHTVPTPPPPFPSNTDCPPLC